MKKWEVFQRLYALILPHRGQFLVVVLVTLLSTAIGLVEPLIYREAINDIAGLFVKSANDQAKTESGVEVEIGEGTLEEYLHNLIHSHDAQPTPVSKTHEKKPHDQANVAERTPGEAVHTLLTAVLLMLGVNVVSYILWRIAENRKTRLDCQVEQEFIQRVFSHVLHMPLAFFGRRASSALAKQIDQSEAVSAVVGAFSQSILPEILGLVGIVAIMFWQNATLALIAISLIPVYLIVAWRSSRALETGLDQYYEKWEDAYAAIPSSLEGVKTVKLSGAEEREVAAYREVSGRAYQLFIDRARLSNKFTFWEGIISHVATALVLGCGGYLALVHKLTPGDVVMFVSYLDRLYSPIDELCSLWVVTQQHTASISRAYQLLEDPSDEQSGVPLQIGEGRIEFQDVDFSYTSERQVLKSLSMTFEPGRVTAVVGGSGAGKTTAVDLMLKLYEPQRGEIRIDGQALHTLDSSSVRSRIGMVAADGAIFRGTLASNLKYKSPDATDAEVIEVVHQVGLGNLMARLPQGLNTSIGTGGIGLSVGERQRVQIARVLLSHPRILVLDEATANLDYNTETEVKRAIHSLRGHCTIIIIAHRFSMVHDADYVYVLSEGQVLESGTPDALQLQGGWFADFASAASEQTAAAPESDSDDSNDEEDSQ